VKLGEKMTDEIYRPQRPNQNPQQSNPMQNLPHQHPAFNPAMQPEPVPPHIAQRMEVEDESKVKISGNIPPKLLERLQKTGGVPEQQAPVFTNAPSINTFSQNFSGNLQSILESLKSHSSHYEQVTLPSMGRFYDGTDGPTNGVLHIRPMTGEEEQILATPRFVKKGTAINMIFSRCIQENIKPENLLSVDRTFILIYLRGISYGTEYEVEIKDPESDRKFTTVIDLDTLEVENCPVDYGPTLMDVLPKSNLSVTYRLSRGRDEIALQEYREKKLKNIGENGSDDSLIYRTAQLIEEIQGVTDKHELQILIKNLPIQDVSYLRNLVTEPPFGIDTKVTVISPLTSDEFTIELPLEANFFFPRGKKKEKTQA
jgi:hypothetical protein